MAPTRITLALFGFSVLFLSSCKDRDDDSNGRVFNPNTGNATPYEFKIPEGFPDNSSLMPAGNPMTVEGVALGRKLFFEKKLSGDESMSCASCHNQKFGFTDDGLAFSEGIDGSIGKRNSMPLANLAWFRSFFWDGRRLTLEQQAFDPVVDPIEMHETWPNAVDKLKTDPAYADMFLKAFGTSDIDSLKVVMAIAQFERTLISSDSRFDRFMRGEVNLTPLEEEGRKLFMRDREVVRNDVGDIIQIIPGADCFHCHMGTANPLLTDDAFHNTGLDLFPLDSGLAVVTKQDSDVGKFKTPSLRNISFTAPYMHDGRFQTLDEVIDFYSEEVQPSGNIDPLMKNVGEGGVRLSDMQKQALKAFILTFNDSTFINNPDFQDPDI